MVRRFCLALGLALLGFGAGAAHADCDADIKQISAHVDEIQNERVKQLLRFDIDRAERESIEGDDAECKEATDHAAMLLRSKH